VFGAPPTRTARFPDGTAPIAYSASGGITSSDESDVKQRNQFNAKLIRRDNAIPHYPNMTKRELLSRVPGTPQPPTTSLDKYGTRYHMYPDDASAMYNQSVDTSTYDQPSGDNNVSRSDSNTTRLNKTNWRTQQENQRQGAPFGNFPSFGGAKKNRKTKTKRKGKHNRKIQSKRKGKRNTKKNGKRKIKGNTKKRHKKSIRNSRR
jgi:hypothetical protein